MRLVIEIVGQPFPSGACEVGVSHYGELNGDATKGPTEITFLVTPNENGEWQWKPLTFLNDYLGAYQVAAESDQFGSLRVRDARLMRELQEVSQRPGTATREPPRGFIEEFNRQYGQAANGVQNGATHAVS